MKTFYINRCNPSGGGPDTFGWRLKQELINQGHEFTKRAQNNLAIIDGSYKENVLNILRLDGLYLDSEDPTCEAQNSHIFKAYKSFDHIVFQSQFSKQVYESFAGISKPSTIIHNGVPSAFNPDIPHPKVDNFEKVLIASAKWRRHKRLEEILQAFSSPQLKDIALIVLDGQNYKPALEHPNPNQNIILFPRIAHDKLPEIYATADAMIHISWLDWCPNTVVEGLACGLPVLCSHNGGTKELVKKNGKILQLEEDYTMGTCVDLYNPPLIDINLLVEGILNILDMPKNFRRPDLSIKKVASQYLNIFK